MRVTWRMSSYPLYVQNLRLRCRNLHVTNSCIIDPAFILRTSQQRSARPPLPFFTDILSWLSRCLPGRCHILGKFTSLYTVTRWRRRFPLYPVPHIMLLLALALLLYRIGLTVRCITPLIACSHRHAVVSYQYYLTADIHVFSIAIAMLRDNLKGVQKISMKRWWITPLPTDVPGPSLDRQSKQ